MDEKRLVTIVAGRFSVRKTLWGGIGLMENLSEDPFGNNEE